MRGHLLIACAAAVLPSSVCAESQSALAAHGDEASRIAWLTWVLFTGATLILVIVVGALALAMRGPAGPRRALSGERAVKLLGIAFPVVTLALLLAYGVWLMRDTIATERPPELRIGVTGEQWWWRIAYQGADGGTIAEANELRIPVGREVELSLRSTDVIHSFWTPSLGGKLDMIPGRTNALRIKADRAGIYRGQCAEYCGGPHALMALEVVAVPASEFEAWLGAASGGAAAAPDAAAGRGQALFLAAGCGGCHAVRGTAASGTVGPDLSRLGARRFLAAASLPNTAENLGRFITAGQSVKPGNLMPEFRIFTAEELNDLTAYLGSLK